MLQVDKGPRTVLLFPPPGHPRLRHPTLHHPWRRPRPVCLARFRQGRPRGPVWGRGDFQVRGGAPLRAKCSCGVRPRPFLLPVHRLGLPPGGRCLR